MKILIATEKPFAKVAVDGICDIVKQAGHECALLEKYTETAQFLQAVGDADALIVRSDKVTKEVVEAAKQLKIVVRAGAGYDNLDLDACSAHNIVAMNTPGQNSNAVAELVFGMLVYAYRGFFSGSSGRELLGKKLGILAYGHVGRNVARIAKGFGMEIYAFDQFVPKDVIEQDGVKAVSSRDELFEMCDVVSLHIPATPETKKSINAELLAKMPKGAVVVNTARKEVIDEESVLSFMESRPDFKYVSDIAPDNLDSFKKFASQFYATPKKMGAQTEEANVNAGLAAAKQIVAFFNDGCTKYQVNK